jgi:four helix bundle protein
VNAFENLEVWKQSVQLCADLYIELKDSKEYGFKDQITRAALSIPSNIAEGCEHDSINEKLRYLAYAKASSGELQTQLTVGAIAGFIDPAKADKWNQQARKFSAMIVGLKKSLQNKTETN